MPLTTNQVELIKRIQEGLQRGDINAIAKKVGLSRVRVSQCLNVGAEFFNEKVAEAAVDIISKRDESVGNMLEQIRA
jgi:hypothetical protein